MTEPFIIGWEEWVALPDLGLPAIKAKVDTGARTSALHARLIEPFGPVDAPLVRFAVNPIAGRRDVEITCSAPIVGRRDVTSSNGERESRYVIRTDVRIGPRTWPIEMTLTNRDSMSYRMLLGRQAIRDDMYVDPASSFRQPKLSIKVYRQMSPRDSVRRSLRMAILSTRSDSQATLRLIAAAAERGHVVESLHSNDLAIAFDGVLPRLMLGETPLGHFDIVIPRIDGASDAFAINILRQLELMGARSLNSADAIQSLADPLAMRQLLQASGIDTPGPTRIRAGEMHIATMDDRPTSPIIRVLVVGHRAIAAMNADEGGRLNPIDTTPDPSIRRTATNTARVLKLRLAAVDIASNHASNVVIAVSPSPQLTEFAEIAGVVAEPRIIADVEGQIRSLVQDVVDDSAREPSSTAH